MFMAKVQVTASCWFWTAAVFDNGYGSFADGKGSSCRAHRWLYEYLNGDLPPGSILHHACGDRLCVNPAHLEVLPSQSDHAKHHSFGGDWRNK